MPVSPKTKNVLVYEKLRLGIIKGKLKPGQRLVMADLAQDFGSSETPVREAIRRLESDGYVIFTPHAGAVVTRIDNGELSEIYLIRIALETLATRLAVSYVDTRDIDWLKKKNQDMKAAIERSRYDALARMNREFHLRIYKAAPYPRLYKMIVDLWDALERWPSIFSYVPERAVLSVQEHELIIDALTTGDMNRVEALLREQKERTFNSLKNYMVQTESSAPGKLRGRRKKQKTPAGQSC